ncbi:MAG: NAD(P)/FAD-dependent oxidoreductase [Promethearchaeota archaeon]
MANQLIKDPQYDVIIIGAGSLGVPTAMACAHDGLRTLVLDKASSPGQGENKHAIGGIRATHTQRSKILLGLRSIDIFSTWQEKYGDDIGWVQGGYCYVSYTPEHEKLFKNNVKLQKNYGLNIDYYGPEKIKELIPGINSKGLLGGTFSPGDGSASPLLALNAFYREAKNAGAEFHFKETVEQILMEENHVIGVKTDKGTYYSKFIVNAAGSRGKKIGEMAGVKIPINPTSHEAAITEPVEHFLDPMVVDIRAGSDPSFGNSNNYYYYQNNEGQIIFCITPNPPFYGLDHQETSLFLPQVAKRMIALQPRLRNIRIRRTWRGLYPDTPDGAPILGKVKNVDGFILASGPCGQGYMLGPGIGEVLSRLIRDDLTKDDQIILDELSLDRDFGTVEMLK